MRAAYDAATVRAAEQPLLDALPEGTLMQRAAFALARRCAALLGEVYGARVVLLVGSGGNGGDALYAGARLAARGARVDALLFTDRPLAAALDALRDAGGRATQGGGDGDAALLASADLVLDGLVGIGGSGPLREPMAGVARRLDSVAATVVAVDVPSGVDASTGEVEGAAVRADVTVTFGATKIGLLVDPGAERAGVVECIDIGLQLPNSAVTALDADDLDELLPAPGAESDKYRRGVLGVVAGSEAFPGAAALVVGGALGVGVGMVRFVSVEAPAAVVRAAHPEAVVTEIAPGDADAALAAGRVQAWAIGPGLGTDAAAARLVAAILSTGVPVVVDADAITALAANRDLLRRRAAPTLLTPHAGEFARLVGGDRSEVEARRLSALRGGAEALGATILLKGSTTLVATPDGAVRVNTASTPYLATAGSGDVLSGICGALLAGGLDPLDAGSAGAFVHGLAGLLASGEPAAPITAPDILRAIPAAVQALRA
ncbi:MAG TPA: NAD(P)H-hydrate dehydratase [Mycobacteriales bacterium]|nr:NAD(P)H-hydrate dehydratase [Mycobacteriales bacterium]